jgi:PKD repeat protein
MRALAVILAIGIVLMTESAISQSKLAATPTSGAPPLVVDFTGAGSGAAEGVMVLDFGDGQTDDSISTVRAFKRTHTYAAAGTYTAVLKSGAFDGQRPSALTIVGRVEIKVQ